MKVGLVLECGASRASFSNGVLDVLLKEGIAVDHIVGTSAGIGSGLSFASGQRGRNHEINRRFLADPRYMGKQHLLRKDNRSYYNIGFVFDKIPNRLCPFDYKAFDRFGGEVLACVTNMKTGCAEYLPLDASDRSWKKVQASCSLPLLFRPVELEGERYMDGGVAVSVPFEEALAAGCDRVIVILTRERSYRKTKRDALTDAAAVYYSRYPRFAKQLLTRNRRYNAERERLFQLEREGKVFVLAPDRTLHFSRTERDGKAIQRLYCQGCREAKSRMAALRAYFSEETEK